MSLYNSLIVLYYVFKYKITNFQNFLRKGIRQQNLHYLQKLYNKWHLLKNFLRQIVETTTDIKDVIVLMFDEVFRISY